MKRRGFFKLVAGVLLAPFLPVPRVYRPDQVIVTIAGKRISGFQGGTFFGARGVYIDNFRGDD